MDATSHQLQGPEDVVMSSSAERIPDAITTSTTAVVYGFTAPNGFPLASNIIDHINHDRKSS